MSASIVSRPCLAAAAASRARLVSRAARASTASSSSNDKLHARAHPIQVRGLAQITRAKKGGFMAEMEEAKAEESGAKVEFTLPLAIQKYPHVSLRNDNKIIGVFDAELEKLAQAMFKIMYETEGVGLAAPQVGVNYRMMVYNEAGEPGRGKEVVLVNPKIVKFSKTKDLFEEGCLSFPKIYADVEVRSCFEFPALVPFALLFFPPRRARDARERAGERKQRYTLFPARPRGCRRAFEQPTREALSSRCQRTHTTGTVGLGFRLTPYLPPDAAFPGSSTDPFARPAHSVTQPPPHLLCRVSSQRPTSVQVEAQNVRGKKFKMTLDGFEARVFQHEYDHLDGVLFHDRMTDEVRGSVQGELDALIDAHPAGEPKGV